jgi:hypothetical protein
LGTRRALREGGYEMSRAHTMYHRPAPFAASTARLVFRATARAAAQLRAEARERRSPLDRSLIRLGQLLSFGR